MQPKFGRLHAGPWPHEGHLGVGLSFIGAPSDPGKFIQLLQDVSCHPVATRRILDTLQGNGEHLATVTASLDFHELGEALARLGVRMKVIGPSTKVRTTETSLVDSCVLRAVQTGRVEPVGLPRRLRGLFRTRLPNAQRSFEELPQGLGRFT